MELMLTVFAIVGLIAFANMAVGIGVKFRAWLGRVVGQRFNGRGYFIRATRSGFNGARFTSSETSNRCSRSRHFLSSRRAMCASSTNFSSSKLDFSIAEKLRALVIGALLLSTLFTVFGFTVGAGIAMIPGVESNLSVHKLFGTWSTLFVVFALLLYFAAKQNGRW